MERPTDHQGGDRCPALWQIHAVRHVQDYLRAQGVAPEQIIAINFEDLDFEELTDYKALYRYVKRRLLPDRMNYIFLDEIQHVADYQKAVDSLFLQENCDLYLTGSNGYFLSGELATC